MRAGTRKAKNGSRRNVTADMESGIGPASRARDSSEAETGWVIGFNPAGRLAWNQASLVLPGTGSGSIGSFMSQDRFSGTSWIFELRACSQVTSWPV